MGSALLLMSVVGGGLFPLIFGSIIDYNPENPRYAILILVPCLSYLLFYSVYGYKIKNWKIIPSGNPTLVDGIN